MKTFPHGCACVRPSFILAVMFCAAHVAKAQDPIVIAPEHYKVLRKTEGVRILEYRDTSGHKVPRHIVIDSPTQSV
jgi:hypothetical protein